MTRIHFDELRESQNRGGAHDALRKQVEAVLDRSEREKAGEYAGRRWEAFKAWRTRVPLLAAPESGLSARAATAILDASDLDASRKEELRDLRIERARFALDPNTMMEPPTTTLVPATYPSPRERATPTITPEDAQRWLTAQVDAHFPDHPWLTRVGPAAP